MRRIEVNRAALKIISTEFLFFPITKPNFVIEHTHDSHRIPASKHDQEVNMCPTSLARRQVNELK